MPVVTLCPGCKKKSQIDTDLIGRKVTCGHCETLFIVNKGMGVRVENANRVTHARVNHSDPNPKRIEVESSSPSDGNATTPVTEHSHRTENARIAVQSIAMFYYNESPGIARYLGDFLLSLFDGGEEPGEIKIPPDIDHPQVQYLVIEGWIIALPSHCIICGKKTKRVFHLEEQVLSPGFSTLIIGIGIIATIVFWFSQIGWYITLPCVLLWLVLGYFVSRRIPVELAFSRCKNHAESDVIPRLRIFEKSLIIEVDHRRIRREFFRTEEIEFNTVNDSLLRQTAAERRETWQEAREKDELDVDNGPDLAAQQALRTGIFLEMGITNEEAPAKKKAKPQVRSGQCPHCEHPIKTDIDQCPACDASFLMGNCSACGNSCSVESPCGCNAGLIVLMKQQ